MRTGLNTPIDLSLRSPRVKDFVEGMNKRVVGQEDAVKLIADLYETFAAGLNPPNRPIANVLLLGPTGVGKTKIVESMAETLFGNMHAMLKVNCAEFQHSHEIAKLVGSPPGYLGHRETHPMFTQEALNQWHSDSQRISIILFDEIEKASDTLWRLLLGILDKAQLTLGDNRKVDFSRAFIVMTSNVGAAEMEKLVSEKRLGFSSSASGVDHSKVEDVARAAARRLFSPEFINRLDRMVVFRNLQSSHLEQIVQLELGALQQRILQSTGNSQFVFQVTPKLKEYLLLEGFDQRYGARNLKRVIERTLTNPFARAIANGQIKLGDFIEADINAQGDTILTKKAEGALVPVLLEKYGKQYGQTTTAKKAARGVSNRESDWG